MKQKRSSHRGPRQSLLAWSFALATILVAARAEAQSAPRAHSVTGRVTDSIGVALEGARVGVIADGVLTGERRTNERGMFEISAMMGERNVLIVRRLGFEPYSVSLAFPRDSVRVLQVRLESSPVHLAGMEVRDRAEERSGWLEGFYRRQLTSSFGRFYTEEVFKARPSRHASEVLRMMPGAHLIPAGRGGYLVRLRNCKVPPTLWLDGMRMYRAELDDLVKASDIAGLEVYTATAGAPAQFMDRSNSGCGTLVVWTRQQ